MQCEELIIYPGNKLEFVFEANIENEDGTTTELDLSIYDTINIHFKTTRDAEPLIELSTETGEGLTVDGNTITVSKEISDDITYNGQVMYDIEGINDSGKTTYGPGFARIIKKITNPPVTT